MSLSKWLPCDIEQCHPLLWGGGILVDHWSTISSYLRSCLYDSADMTRTEIQVWWIHGNSMFSCESNVTTPTPPLVHWWQPNTRLMGVLCKPLVITRVSEVIMFSPCVFVITRVSEVIMFSPCVFVTSFVCLFVFDHDVCPDDLTMKDWCHTNNILQVHC